MGCIESTESKSEKIWVLSSLSRHEWLEWKKCFLTYRQQKFIPQHQENRKFFKYTGFLGEEIAKKLYFQNSKDEEKLNILLFKFDVYFMYGKITRSEKEDLNEYVLFLKNVAEKLDKGREIDCIVKEKILQDFKSKDIFRKLQNKDFSCRISSYEQLTVSELKFLWEENDKLQHDPMKKCSYCNRNHAIGNCIATGKKCWNCKGLNHFAVCCSSLAIAKDNIIDCCFCGSEHNFKRCPAYAKQCSKCKRMNHFSWMCSREVIQSCMYCGGSHIDGRQYCTAKNSLCTNCFRRGHFSSNCHFRRHRRFR